PRSQSVGNGVVIELETVRVVTSMTSMAEPPQRETNTSEPTATRPCALLRPEKVWRTAPSASSATTPPPPLPPLANTYGYAGSALTATRPKLVSGRVVELDGTRTFGTG